MGEWKIGETDAYEVTIPGTEGSARGTFVDMGNPHVVAVIEDAFASLPVVESLDLVTKPVVAPVIESDQNVEFVRVDDIDQNTGVGEATMRVNERGCGETLSCGTGLCATGIVLRAKTRHQPLGHHRTWRHPARGRHRQRRKADRSSHAGRRYRFVVKESGSEQGRAFGDDDEYHDRHDPQYVDHEVDVEAVILIESGRHRRDLSLTVAIISRHSLTRRQSLHGHGRHGLNAMNWMGGGEHQGQAPRAQRVNHEQRLRAQPVRVSQSGQSAQPRAGREPTRHPHTRQTDHRDGNEHRFGGDAEERVRIAQPAELRDFRLPGLGHRRTRTPPSSDRSRVRTPDAEPIAKSQRTE